MSSVSTPFDRDVKGVRRALELDMGVITDARRRQRRRRRAIAFVLVAGILIAALGQIGSGGRVENQGPAPPRSHSGSTSGSLVAPAEVFAQQPYMGVACAGPNSISCDRVGLAAWLRRPAVAVRATIAGAALKLDWAGDRPPTFASQGPRTEFTGFLQPAALTTRLGIIREARLSSHWAPSPHNAPAPLVRFWVDYGNGEVVMTEERVALSGGWG